VDKRVSAYLALSAYFVANGWYFQPAHPIQTHGTDAAIEAPEPAQSGNPMRSPPEPNPVGYTRISGTATETVTLTTTWKGWWIKEG
jgi:hypothetical protein